MGELFLKLKSIAGKHWKIGALGLAAVLLLASILDGCSKKANSKALKIELEKCYADYTALDTAQLEVALIDLKKEAILRDVPVPVPSQVADKSVETMLRAQISRNKLKQVAIIGDCEADKLIYEAAIKDRDFEIEKIYQAAQLYSDSIGLLVAQLKEAKKINVYSDSIKEETHTAVYKIKTEGTLNGFKLSVNPKTTVITRKIASPAPPAEQYRYKNNLKVVYSPASAWNTKYDITQRAGIEYEYDAGVLGFRLNADYLIEAKDYGASATIYIKPVKWGKKTKK